MAECCEYYKVMLMHGYEFNNMIYLNVLINDGPSVKKQIKTKTLFSQPFFGGEKIKLYFSRSL